MNVIYVLIPIAIIIVAVALLVFFWAVKANQFDDLERQGSAILFDDDVTEKLSSSPREDNSDVIKAPEANIVDPKSDNTK